MAKPEASVQDDGLWRKLLTRAQRGTPSHAYFVIDVVEGCLHTNRFCKLGLPTAFMRHNFNTLDERIILEGPDGHQWLTMLALQLDSQPCLMHGWKEFAEDYNLEIRDQVVFLLFGKSHFLVQVYDVHNKVKAWKGCASLVNNAIRDMKGKSVSQAGTHTHRFDLPSFHVPKTNIKQSVYLILDSSDEEKEEDNDQVHVKHTPIDTLETGGSSSKMTLRSATKLEKEDPAHHALNDVFNELKPDRLQAHDGESIMAQELGETSQFCQSSARKDAPSSLEHTMVLKRSRRLQRISGDYQGDDLGRATSVVRSGKLRKPSLEGEKVPPRLYEDTKVTKTGVKRAFLGSEALTSCCSTQQSTMKKQQKHLQNLQESTSKIPEPPGTLPKLCENRELAHELAAPGTPGGIPAFISRYSVKVSKDMGKKGTNILDLSEDEARKRSTRVGVPVKVIKQMYISKRRPVTVLEKQETLAVARTFANMSASRHYVMQLKSSQVYCGFHLKVQPEFVEAMQLPLSREKLTLSDSSGNRWEVEWLGDHAKWPGLHSAGWTKFVLEHYLEEGDVCVFQKCEGFHNMISVEVFPVVPLATPPRHGWRSHYSVPGVVRTEANSELPHQS